MNRKNHLFIFIILILNLLAFPCLAASLKVPEQTAWIMDNAGVIDSQTEEEIESYLENIDEKIGAQIAVLTINSLEEAAGIDTTIEEYANEVFEKWRLGQKSRDNGVLLLVSVDDRKLRIEVGYGLEGVLTDTKCGIIIRKFITPYFKEGDYAKGIKSGVETIAGYVSGDEETKNEIDRPKKNDPLDFLIPFLMFAVFFGIVFVSELSARKNGKQNGANRRTTSGRRFYVDHDHYNDSDDFGGFGGGSDGGFSGGGGGHSGGGGASGGW